MTLLMVAWFSLDFPFWDQWELVPLLAKIHDGSLGWSDLVAPHNEHRILFPRLLMLGLALMSRWNVRWEQAASLLCAGALCTMLLRVVIARLRVLQWSRGMIWLSSATVVVGLFSLNQWQNWSFGWQCQIFMSVLAVITGFTLLSHPRRGAIRLVFAILAGIVATFSFGNGILFWPVGLMLLWMSRGESRLKGILMVWCALSVAMVAINWGAHKESFPSLRAIIPHFFTAIGAPLFPYHVGAAIGAGMVGLIGAAWLFRRKPDPLALAFVLYAVGTALLLAFARGGEGAEQALSSRYITCTQFFWIGLMFQMISVGPVRQWVLLGTCVIWGFLMAAGSAYGILKWTERHEYRLEARQEVISGSDRALLSRVHPDPDAIFERRDILRHLKYNVYSE